MADDPVDFSLLVKAGADTRSFKAGETIFSEGDPASELFVIASGQVEIRVNGRVVNSLGERRIFGEMALVDGQPRSATALAATDAIVVPVDEKQFLHLVRHVPYFALNVMRTLSGRLRAVQENAFAR
jgi:CRP-like cAMP-binding protein